MSLFRFSQEIDRKLENLSHEKMRSLYSNLLYMSLLDFWLFNEEEFYRLQKRIELMLEEDLQNEI